MSVSNDIHYLQWKMKRNHEKYLSEIVEMFAFSGIQHIVFFLSFFVCFLFCCCLICLVYPMLSISLDCPFDFLTNKKRKKEHNVLDTTKRKETQIT
jgi:hypothetical protein